MRNKKIYINGQSYDYLLCDTMELLLMVYPTKKKKIHRSLINVLSSYFNDKVDLSRLVITAYKERPKKIAYSIIRNQFEIVSILRVIYSSSQGYINMVTTNRKFRRRGLCTKNLHMLIDTLTEVNKFSLQVETHNLNAIECYKKIGFKINDKWKDSKNKKVWYGMVLKL